MPLFGDPRPESAVGLEIVEGLAVTLVECCSLGG